MCSCRIVSLIFYLLFCIICVIIHHLILILKITRYNNVYINLARKKYNYNYISLQILLKNRFVYIIDHVCDNNLKYNHPRINKKKYNYKNSGCLIRFSLWIPV